jgi:hypothetical protein
MGRKNILNDDDADGELVKISMDAFVDLLDTLTLQPKYSLENEDEEESDSDEVEKEVVLPTHEEKDKSIVLKYGQVVVGVSYCCEMGQRETQEDRVKIINGFELSSKDKAAMINNTNFAVCIFDGHSGAECAEYLVSNIQRVLTDRSKVGDVVANTLRTTFYQLDRSY